MWYINLDRSLRFVTIHACDGQTDGQTEFSSLDRVCIACSAIIKTVNRCTRQYQIKSNLLAANQTIQLVNYGIMKVLKDTDTFPRKENK